MRSAVLLAAVRAGGRRLFAVALAAAALTASAIRPEVKVTHPPGHVSWKELAAMSAPPAGHRIAYGPDSLEFGDLRLPGGPGPFPVAILIHGGCWMSEFGLGHIAPFADELARHGIATWTIEYRRVGDPGGGWPGTFADAGRAADHVRELAKRYPLDLSRVVAVGHSAGGHLALWLAARARLPRGSALATANPLPLRGIVALAAISDLSEYGRGTSSCCQSVALLMGGGPEAHAERYAEADPSSLLPLGVPSRLVHGSDDEIVPPEQSRAFARRAAARGDDARFVTIAGANHFALVAPGSSAMGTVVREIEELLRAGPAAAAPAPRR